MMIQLQQIVEKLSAEGHKESRSSCIPLLSELADNLMAARDVWTEALEQASGEAQPFTFVLWFGPERAKALHRLHLEQRRLGAELTEITGISFSDRMGIIDAIDVVEAYAQAARESGPERANTALETLAERGQRLDEVIAALEAV